MEALAHNASLPWYSPDLQSTGNSLCFLMTEIEKNLSEAS